MLDGARHPCWSWNLLRGDPLTFATLASSDTRDTRGASVMALGRDLFDASVAWPDISEIAGTWRGTLVVKGIHTASDARIAAGVGADAVVVSNHGGRQLDRTRPPLRSLPDIADAVGDSLQIYLDSGHPQRRGHRRSARARSRRLPSPQPVPHPRRRQRLGPVRARTALAVPDNRSRVDRARPRPGRTDCSGTALAAWRTGRGLRRCHPARGRALTG